MRFLSSAVLLVSLLPLTSCKSLSQLSFGKKSTAGESDKARSKRESAETDFLAECKRLGAGDSVVNGLDGWLFSGEELKRLGATPEVGSTTFSSAVSAISEYRRQLKEIGVEMVFAIVPPKALIFPDKLSKDAKIPVKKGTPAALDTYFTNAAEALKKKGVKTVYLTEEFLAQRLGKAGNLYAKGGAYPTPQAAKIIAQAIAKETGLPSGNAGLIAKEAIIQGGVGLGGKAEKLPTRQIFRPDGTTPVPLGTTGLPILLLADESVRQWRTDNASLPEQLSFELQRPLGLLTAANARNSQRQKLMALGTTDKNPLASTKLLIWVCQATELSSSDWAVIPLKLNFKMADPTIRLN